MTDYRPPEIPVPDFRELQETIRRKNNPALAVFEELMQIIKSFEARLDNDAEVGALVSGASAPFHVQRISRRLPSLLIFEGVDDDGQATVAVQHVTQLDFRLVGVKKLSDSPPHRVGFWPGQS